ncbi:glycoside hydrolase family 43 protein [Novosphingobium kaempferiae]|uniref:glycoside hydrolase family 43 protein n=1 Tax=Novosphingobium kaempferiae TaxID=2896849 RepID=UPI001E64E6FF|nr:glycoside hydrolase family 43 protein [Novosphingobium kaempferiae]
MTNISNPILRGFNPDPSIVRVGDDFFIATSTFEWFPGVQIHHSRDLVHWRLAARPLRRASQLDMRGDPDSCGVWAPDLTHAHGRFWLVFTDVKRYGMTTVNGAAGVSLRDFPNYLVWSDHIDGDWSDPVHLNSSGFDPSLFHDEHGQTWILNMLWDHRPGRGRFAGIQIQQLDRDTMALVGEPTTIFEGTERGFTEGPHLYQKNGWFHLLVAEGGTGWNHAVVMARSRHILGPYEVHPDGEVLTAAGSTDGPLTRAGHGDLVEMENGTVWMAYLCGRPASGTARCIMGRETAIQEMVWGHDGWLRAKAARARPELTPRGPELPLAPWPAERWDGRFDTQTLPSEFQWLRSPYGERLFSLTANPGYLRLYGRETVGSVFEQALVARRQTDFKFRATTEMTFAPQSFQQAAGLIYYYNSTKFYYLHVTAEGQIPQLQLMQASPEQDPGTTLEVICDLPDGPYELRIEVDTTVAKFGWRVAGATAWQWLPHRLDATILSDEVTSPGLPNFTGAFVGMACQDLSGAGTPADFASFVYVEEGNSGIVD